MGGHRLDIFDFEAKMAEQATAEAGFRVGFVEQFQEGAGGERQKGAVAGAGGIAELVDDAGFQQPFIEGNQTFQIGRAQADVGEAAHRGHGGRFPSADRGKGRGTMKRPPAAR